MGHGHGPGVQQPTAPQNAAASLPPAPNRVRSSLREQDQGSRLLSLRRRLVRLTLGTPDVMQPIPCPTQDGGSTPPPQDPPHLAVVAEGAVGLRVAAAVAAAPAERERAAVGRRAHVRGRRRQHLHHLRLHHLHGGLRLGPPAAGGHQVLQGLYRGEQNGLSGAGGGGTAAPAPRLSTPPPRDLPFHSRFFCTAIFSARFSCFSFWLLCCRKRMYSIAFLRIADLLSCRRAGTTQPKCWAKPPLDRPCPTTPGLPPWPRCPPPSP